jgi:hypothetical protein
MVFMDFERPAMLGHAFRFVDRQRRCRSGSERAFLVENQRPRAYSLPFRAPRAPAPRDTRQNLRTVLLLPPGEGWDEGAFLLIPSP